MNADYHAVAQWGIRLTQETEVAYRSLHLMTTTIAPHPCQSCLDTPGFFDGQPCDHCYGTGLGPQGAFLASTADYLLYGGQAGGGKTFSLVLKAARYFRHPRFNAVLFRQTRREVLRSLWKEARYLLPLIDRGVEFNKTELTATSSTGASIEFAFAESPEQIERFQSAQYSLVGFDEGTHTPLGVIRFMNSRIRSPDPELPKQLCICTNPGGQSHDAIFADFEPWLNPLYRGPGGPAKPWEKRWFVPDHDDRGQSVNMWVPEGAPGARSANFIPAALRDNPTIYANDPYYVERMKQLDMVTYERLAGTMFRREWFPVIVTAQGFLHDSIVRCRVRTWDRAHTEGAGDWTVGARWVLTRDGKIVLEDVARAQLAPGRAEELMWRTASQDPRGTTQWIPDDPGAGTAYADTLLREAIRRGVRMRVCPIAGRGDKITKAKGISAKAWRGEVQIVFGPWNDIWLDEHTSFPDQCQHDDQVDTSSDADIVLADFRNNGRFTIGRDRPK